MEKLLSNIEKYVLYAVIFLLPITFLFISPNPFVVSKLAVLSFGLAVLLLIRAVRVISSGRLDFSVGNFDFPVFLILLAYTLSTVFRTPNKMEGLLLPGTATAVVGASLIYFLINQLKEKEKHVISYLLVLSSGIFSFLTILAFAGLFSKIPQLPAFMRAQGFTPEGGYLPAAIFLAVTLPIGIGLILSEKKLKDRLILGIAGFFIIVGLVISCYNLLPHKPFSPRFPSFNTSWAITVDSLKDSPILGIGPGNYLTAFNRFRPITYNQTDLWALKFATANDFYLSVMTETGLLGFAALAILIFAVYKMARQDIKERRLVNWGFAGSANLVALTLLIIIFAIFPATVLLTILLFILLALVSKTKQTSLNLTTQAPTEAQGPQGFATKVVGSRFPALLITIPVIIVVSLFLFRAARVVSAEYKFKKALDRLAANDAAGTYDTLREAIRLNPQVDRYHATFARVNLALANAIAQKAAGTEKPEGQPAQISDEDRQNITVLIQQAINEAKANVALNPLRAGNWEILGQTYRSIMALAKGADDFAIQSYRQAVALDPVNPNLRIALGGIHYAKNDFDTAVRTFELATLTKPDHANAHYNLAFALRENGELNKAIQEMTLVLSLIQDKDSQDYEIARQALEDMQAKLAAQAPEGKELNPPQEGKQILEPPISLPEGTEPPKEAITPTPTPEEKASAGTTTPTITPQITPTPTQIP